MATNQIKNGFQGGSDDQLKVNPDGSINVSPAAGSSFSANIHDSSGNDLTSTDGSLNVNITGDSESGTGISEYNEITGVAMSATATVFTYTVPPGQTLSLSRVLFSSDSISIIEVKLDSATNAKGRICYTDYNLTFDYNNLLLIEGTIIDITATNMSLQGAASFNVTLQGTLK